VKNFLKDIVRKRYSVRPLEEGGVTLWKTFSFGEKCLMSIFVVVFAISGISLLFKVSNAFLIEVPERGGFLEEGIIGAPRFINPLLAISDSDKDLTSLVYGGLLKATPEGTLIPDLAQKWSVSEDSLTYTFTLKDDIYFHDGEPVTAEDVLFTVQKAIDPLLKSPRRGNFEGVTVRKVNDNEITFTLRQPYAPFIENATLGILPKHIWKNASSDEFAFSEYNTTPVGSGPYIVHKVKRSSAGLPTLFELKSFSKYNLGRPYIENLYMHVYQNEEDLTGSFKSHTIESMGSIRADTVSTLNTEDFTLYQASLPRVFGLFFNQNQANVFLHKEVREALDISAPKENITQTALLGFGSPIESPVPHFAGGLGEVVGTDTEKAKEILETHGWKIGEDGIRAKKSEKLSFSISTSDAPELKKTAEILKAAWLEIGVEVDIKVFESGDLNQNVIRPRKYDALLFGIIVGRDVDLYPFWHSSQRNDPGLNIALYANITTDKILEQVRSTINKDDQRALYQKFEKEILEDIPAIFLYSPDFLYILPHKVRNVRLGHVQTAGERFLNIHEWFIETNKVWKIFTKEKEDQVVAEEVKPLN